MGVMLTPIVHREQTSLKALARRSFAVDGNIELHQFLALIRKQDGTLFTDNQGHVTSHLIGLLTRTTRLINEYGMRLVFVFDGRFNPLKRATMEERRRIREKAEVEYRQAVERGDNSSAWSKAVMTGRVTGDVLTDAKELLSLMGLPWIIAPEDAEAQASMMAQKGDVWAVGGKDYDSLLYGAPRLVRYLTITGTEYLPSQRRTRRLIPEIISLSQNLQSLGLTREQFVDLAILVGTDFNPGIRGIGPKKALILMRKFGGIDGLPPEIRGKLGADPTAVREVFLHPATVQDYKITFSRPDVNGLFKFLVEERGFARERVENAANLLTLAYDQNKDANLGAWLS
ncbi:MAG TPA: flap endonuclease-1 [Candidatus Binatus sp.]|nr:flap endonuclease-1 [Candidatus Binatus sp.]